MMLCTISYLLPVISAVLLNTQDGLVFGLGDEGIS